MAPSPPSVPAEHPHLAGYWKRRSAAAFRWLHIYVSMVSFGILFFFAITGLTLNHADWFFGDHPTTTQRKGKLDPKWVAPGAAASVAKLEVAEFLRRTHGVAGSVSEFRVEDGLCAVTFKGPGYSADAQIDRATGNYELSENRLGFVAIINDLHKGRDTGPGWSVVVDLSAVLMVVVSLSGMVLIYFVKRRFVSGLIMAALGAGISVLAYVCLVP
jgi:hypothetical protein